MTPITIFNDPIDISAVVTAIQHGGIAVLDTVRPNARSIAKQAEEVAGQSVIHLSVEADGDWHHYLHGIKDGDFSIDDAECLVKQAIALWKTAGYPANYVVSLRKLQLTERAGIAIEKLPSETKARALALLDQLQQGQQISAHKLRAPRTNEEVWVIRLNVYMRLFYSITSDVLTVLDVVEASESSS